MLKTFTIILLIFTMSISYGQKPFSLFENGIYALESGNFNEAVEYFNKEILENPNNIEAYLYRAFSYGQLEEYKNAINDFNYVLEQSPENIAAWINRGVCYKNMGKYNFALDDYN